MVRLPLANAVAAPAAYRPADTEIDNNTMIPVHADQFSEALARARTFERVGIETNLGLAYYSWALENLNADVARSAMRSSLCFVVLYDCPMVSAIRHCIADPP